MIPVGGDVFTVGANHSLTCTASGGASMTYTYQWLRYDEDILGEASSTISFSPLREADVGRYTCQVSDDFLTTTSDGVEINVVSLTVEITPSSPPLEGETYSLNCSIRGIESLQVAMVEYQWTKNGGSISSSSVLNFTPLTLSDDGTYTCTITITSPLLNSTRAAMNNRTLTVIRKFVCINTII